MLLFGQTAFVVVEFDKATIVDALFRSGDLSWGSCIHLDVDGIEILSQNEIHQGSLYAEESVIFVRNRRSDFIFAPHLFKSVKCVTKR